MINLKMISNNKYLIYIFIIIFFFLSNNINSLENKIIFKINNKVFTSIDYEMRIKYLDFVGSNQDLDTEVIMNDFISANLFYEHYMFTRNKNDFENKILEIYKNIDETNKLNSKEFDYEINKENILYNIKIDYIRKIILENIINKNFSNLNVSEDEMDLLYNFKIKYINFENEKSLNLKMEIEKLNKFNFNNIYALLKEKEINFFFKEEEILNIDKINKKIRDTILKNGNFLFLEDDNKISIIFIEKSFETFEGIVVSIYSLKSSTEIDKKLLNCENLSENIRSLNVINKDYQLSDLNDELKSNLVSVNDYIKFQNENENIYIFLCNIKFDKKILNNYNFNKIINRTVSDIESKLIEKYSKTYNLVK